MIILDWSPEPIFVSDEGKKWTVYYFSKDQQTEPSKEIFSSYGANHLVTTTFVQKSYEIKKKSQIHSLLGKCSFW